MEERFWLNRWKRNDIGFHKEEPHQYLLEYFHRLEVEPGMAFFTPLCGKSKDLVWLHGRGVEVIGVELSRLAVDAFVGENRLDGNWTMISGVPCFQAPGYRIFCGDFFRLPSDGLPVLSAAYDRGALVALPGEMRRRYASRLAELMPAGRRVLLISYEYDQCETHGPPFSVSPAEVEALFGGDFLIEQLVEDDVLWSHQGLADRGVTKLMEFAVMLSRRGADC